MGREFKMDRWSYAEVRLLSKGTFDALFRNGDVFVVKDMTGKNQRIKVGKKGIKE